jgi:hypothetical protein
MKMLTKVNKTISALACLLLVCGAACFADETSERAFLWKQANALAASADSPEEYLAAARAYNSLIKGGVRNGPLFYNFGTMLLEAGDNSNALKALLRAERYMGNAPDLSRNIRIAYARTTPGEESGIPWHRALFFWHFRYSAPLRAAAASAAFSLFWILMAARTLGLTRRATTPMIVCAAFFIVMGSSVAASFQQESAAKRISPALSAAPPPESVPR